MGQARTSVVVMEVVRCGQMQAKVEPASFVLVQCGMQETKSRGGPVSADSGPEQ